MIRYRRPLDETKIPRYYYSREIVHVLQRLRTMQRFFDEVIDENLEYRKHYSDLHCAYMDILQEEIAPYALQIALSLLSLEERVGDFRKRFLKRKRAAPKRRPR